MKIPMPALYSTRVEIEKHDPLSYFDLGTDFDRHPIDRGLPYEWEEGFHVNRYAHVINHNELQE